MLPAPLWLALVRVMLVVEDGTRITQLSLHGEGKEEAASPLKKEANPASLRSAVHLSTKIGHETKKIRHKN